MKRIMLRLAGSLVLLAGLTAAVTAQAGTWIVELDQPPAARWLAAQGLTVEEVDGDALQAYRSDLSAAQDNFLQRLAERGIEASVSGVTVPDFDGIEHRIDYRYTLVLNGLALEMDAVQVDQVKRMDGVKAVHEDRMLFTLLDGSVEYIRAPEVYSSIPALNPWDDLHDGLEGQGVTVSVIDTGIEWSHEMFGGDPSPPRFGLNPMVATLDTNEKVIYYLPLHENVVDDFGHGTHAAGITSGFLGFGRESLVGDEVRVHGVAPQSRLMGYKVCSGVGSAAQVFGCLTTSIILAIEDSVSPRTLTGFPKPIAHVINLSLGGSGGPDSATSVAADNAALAGTIVVSSAGNSGPAKGTIGAPSAGRHVISVGANNDPTPGPNSIEVLPDDEFDLLFLASFAADSNAGLPMEEPLVGRYVDAGKADTPDQVPLEMLGNICLVERGSSAEVEGQGTGLFQVKVANCEAKGAVATVIFNNVPGQIGAILAAGSRPVFTTSREAGLTLRDELGFGPGGLSLNEIRLNLPDSSLFTPEMASFSSRGPVLGMGQVKPDVTAPGVAVLSATSPLGVPVLSMQSETRYIRASGTSFSGPHTAGAAALLRQARLDWTPDRVRTALINTATNLRGLNGAPKPDGLGADDVLSQGGGLIDVARAANAPALMGVKGDGINSPGLLGSHSFGAVPVVNSRVTHFESVTVTIEDQAGEAGTWMLSVANNRDLEIDGIDVALSTDSVSVDAGGSASFEVELMFDGDLLREPPVRLDSRTGQFVEAFDTQWYVYAERADGGATLRMPFHLRPTGSLPAGSAGTETETFQGTILAGDQNLGLVEGVTFNNHEVGADASVLRLSADLEFPQIVEGSVPDLDLFVFGPDGEEVASSTNPGGPESVSFRVDDFGTYTFQVRGWLNVATDYTLAVEKDIGGAPPGLDAIDGEYVNAGGQAVDFDGNYTVNWTAPEGNVQAYEVEESVNGGPFEPVTQVDADTTSLEVTGKDNGTYAYRVRAMYPGQIGFFVSAPSNEESVVVDHRQQVDITADTKTAISNVSFAGGVFEFDLRLTNQSANDYVPLVEFNVVEINSASGNVEAINADNGGSGTSENDPALYDYSGQLGDEVFASGETSGARHLAFANPDAELFTFRAVVTAYERTGGAAAGDGSSTDGSEAESSEEEMGLESITQVLEFTVSPLTGTVAVSLIDLS